MVFLSWLQRRTKGNHIGCDHTSFQVRHPIIRERRPQRKGFPFQLCQTRLGENPFTGGNKAHELKPSSQIMGQIPLKCIRLSRPLCVARFGQRFVNQTFAQLDDRLQRTWIWFIGESVVRHLRLQVCLKHWEEDCRLKSVICLKDCSLTLKSSSEQYKK